MAATPESRAKKKVRELLDEYMCYYTMPVTGGYGRSGVPDFVGCHNSKFFGIEVKADTDVTALQMHNLKLIAENGGFALVVRVNKTETSGMKELKKFLEGK